jgi:hypothetical protein
MVPRLTVSAAAIVCSCVVAFAEASPALPLASHRAAYDISLVDPATPPPTSAQTPVSATGLIAYEFRGSACEGYTSNFRQMTEMERSEGDPLSMQVNAMSFEEAGGKSMRFQVDSQGLQETGPVAGTATRGADDDLRVQLTKPQAKSLDFGHDVLFPTQHIEHLIDAAKNGGGAIQARVYDGSDTGAKRGDEARGGRTDRHGSGRDTPLACGDLVFRRSGDRLGARVHAFLRPLRKRRLRQPQAGLRLVRSPCALA